MNFGHVFLGGESKRYAIARLEVASVLKPCRTCAGLEFIHESGELNEARKQKSNRF